MYQKKKLHPTEKRMPTADDVDEMGIKQEHVMPKQLSEEPDSHPTETSIWASRSHWNQKDVRSGSRTDKGAR